MFSNNVIQIKRGSTKPTISTLNTFELGYCTQGVDRGLYINNSGAIVKIGDEISVKLENFIDQVHEEIGFGNHAIDKLGTNITVFRFLGD